MKCKYFVLGELKPQCYTKDDCPRSVGLCNKFCEIIKPKPTTNTFKAWAHMWGDNIHCVQLRKQDFANLSLEPNAVVLPCVITIASKYLKK